MWEDLNTKYNTLSKKWLLVVSLPGHKFAAMPLEMVMLQLFKGKRCLQKLHKLLSQIPFQAKLAGATQRQTESYLKPLLRKLKHKVMQTETIKLLFCMELAHF